MPDEKWTDAELKAELATERLGAESPRPWYKKKRFIIPGALLVLAAIGSAGSDDAEDVATVSTTVVTTSAPSTSGAPKPTTTEASATTTTGKFTQTWKTGYGETTCADWHNVMLADQRRVAAADMLVGARATEGGDPDLPSDSLIAKFRDDISEGCEPVPTWSISDIAVAVYKIGRVTYSP